MKYILILDMKYQFQERVLFGQGYDFSHTGIQTLLKGAYCFSHYPRNGTDQYTPKPQARVLPNPVLDAIHVPPLFSLSIYIKHI